MPAKTVDMEVIGSISNGKVKVEQKRVIQSLEESRKNFKQVVAKLKGETT